ncbi:MAG TPA: cupredoxin domain-containing protein [Gemmatimonadales bacterium]|jgi:plastocyanin|nr:cupredoxin domain-containing protein [Gemmatimonadales bacterium]
MLWYPLILTLTAGHVQASTVTVKLSEWKVELSRTAIGPGPVTFIAKNTGTIPHQFEVEGKGLEKETAQIAPGDSAVLTLDLKAGDYEVYCPIGEGSHEKLGMKAKLHVGNDAAEAEVGSRLQTAVPSDYAQAPSVKVIHVKGGGPVVQILPGPFPFPDSVNPVIPGFGPESVSLRKQEANGPFSNNVAKVTGTFAFTAWEKGAVRDSVEGEAAFTTQDGAKWRLDLYGVQTNDIPHHPRFGGVIMGLYYHGNTTVHSPLVPTINSRVALWTYGKLYRNDSLVTENAQVHVMLLSRTRRLSDFALQCWDCSKQPQEELQLQITPAAGSTPLPASGGVLFLNWEKSSGK